MVYKLLGRQWFLGPLLCHIWIDSDYLLTCGSVLNVAMLSLDISGNENDGKVHRAIRDPKQMKKSKNNFETNTFFCTAQVCAPFKSQKEQCFE